MLQTHSKRIARTDDVDAHKTNRTAARRGAHRDGEARVSSYRIAAPCSYSSLAALRDLLVALAYESLTMS